jgi:hypothetical protein
MGLYISYDAFEGAYSSFHRYRKELAKRIGIPLDLMEGFYSNETHNMFSLLNSLYPKGDEVEMILIREFQKILPLKWRSFKPNPLHKLLNHSDCDGNLSLMNIKKIVPELKKLLNEDEKETEFYKKTKQFIEGATEAIKNKVGLEFS